MILCAKRNNEKKRGRGESWNNLGIIFSIGGVFEVFKRILKDCLF